MSENQNNTTFQYTYSAKEHEELRHLRSKYAPKTENKLELLRRMDAQVTMKATMYAIIIGVIGALVFGVGMCCCLIWANAAFGLGIVVGILGLAVLSLAYPVYNRTIRTERQRIAPEVLRLTDELMK